MFAVTLSTLLTIIPCTVIHWIFVLLVIPLTAVALHSKVVALPYSTVSILVTSTTGLGTVNKQNVYVKTYVKYDND